MKLGHIEPGQEQVFELHPGGGFAHVLATLIEFLCALSTQKHWKITIKAWHRKRTDLQNDYLWGVCYKLIEQATGQPAKDWHEFFMGEIFGWREVEFMGKKRLRRKRSSSRMSTVEFAGYVEEVRRRAAEFNIYIPDPDPLYKERKSAIDRPADRHR